MTSPDNDSSMRGQKLDSVIAAYLREKDSGKSPDLDEWLKRYPEFASELSAFFLDQQQIEGIIGQRQESPDQEASDQPTYVAPQPEEENGGSQSTAYFHAHLPNLNTDRYVVNKFLARGGMGEVYLAEDVHISRQVAVKKLLGQRPEQRDRFMAEAQITGQLEHPAIIPLHDFGVDEDGCPFYVMKYVQGVTLKEAILEFHSTDPSQATSRKIQLLQLLEVFIDLCQAVAFAHSRGVLHRDLKPDNVMLGQFGETLVIDWGLAKVAGLPDQPDGASYVHVSSSSGSTATQDGSVMGSPSYMAPEVAEGRISNVDETTDVYLLGATLYEILTGRPPREGSSQIEMIDLARTVTPPAPRRIDSSISPGLEAICVTAMSYRMQDRYQSATEVADDVHRYLAGEPVSTYRENFLQRSWRWCKRHHRMIKRTAAAAALATCAMFVLSIYREREKLRALEQFGTEVTQFQELADKMRFYATGIEPASEHAPYYDIGKGIRAGEEALAVISHWGEKLDRLPDPNQRDVLSADLYDILLLMVQTELQKNPDKTDVEELIGQLDRARALHVPTRSYYRLRMTCDRLLGHEEQAQQNQRHAADPQTRSIAVDYFLKGESFRVAASKQKNLNTDPALWRPNRELLEQAMDEYRLALERQPSHYWSHLQVGRCLMSLGRTSEAVESLGVCVALRPDSPWGYSSRGLARAILKRYPLALGDLDHAIRLQPDFLPTLLNRGVTLWLKGDQQAALADFDEILKRPEEKRLIEAAYYRGQIRLKQNDLRAALADLEQVVRERPGFRHVYRLLAEIYFRQADDNHGTENLNSFLLLSTSDPFDADAWQACHHRGRFLRLLVPRMPSTAAMKRRIDLLKLAKMELSNAVKRGGKSAELFEDLGAVVQMLSGSNAAIQIYTQGLQQDADSPKILNLRGWAHALGVKREERKQNRKRLELALVDFKATLRIAPDNSEAHTGAGFVLSILESPADAQKSAAEALLHGAGDYFVLHNVACIYAELSLLDDAREKEHQDLAMDILSRAVELWQRGGSGEPNELTQIKYEPSFTKAMRSRADFIKLVEQ